MKITHPKIDWRGATPIAADYGDIYYSPEDAVGEVRHNFVSCLEPMMGQRDIIVIGETGFGTGLNFLVTWHDWLKRRRAGDRLIFISTEAHPLRPDDLRRALAPFPELKNLADQLIDVWPVGIPGPHRRFFDAEGEQGKIELWVLYGDAYEELQRQGFQADAWYFDGFNPAENPALWSPELIRECARLMTPGAIGGTFTVASAVRAAMADAGLKLEKAPGFGRKREYLKIKKPGAWQRPKLRPLLDISILGDGIAGTSTHHAATKRGIGAVAYLPKGAEASHRASGNPTALINFKPTKAPSTPGNRLLAASLAHVQPLYEHLWLPGRGTHKPAKDSTQAEDFAASHQAMGWADDCLTLDQDALESMSAGYVRPQAVIQHLMDQEYPVDENEVEFDDHRGPLVLAMGFGVAARTPSLVRALRRNLGQVDVFGDGPGLNMPVTYGGYITPQFGGQVLAGSTYDRNPDWDDPDLLKPKQSATNEIVEKAFKAGFSLPFTAKESHVSARAFGKDHLPIVGQTADGAWVLTGLGSRGFLTAPLLAEILLDEMEGREAAGLPTYDFKGCVHPSRFG